MTRALVLVVIASATSLGACSAGRASSNEGTPTRPSSSPVRPVAPIDRPPPVASAVTSAVPADAAEPSDAGSTSSGEATVDPLASKDAERAIAAVLALPGAKGLCEEAKARGAAGCSAWATDAPSSACASADVAYGNLGCWWGVGLFERMSYPDGSGHANPLATFWVEPKAFRVVAGSTFECGDLLFTLPALRRLKMRKSPPKNDDDACAGSIPHEPPP